MDTVMEMAALGRHFSLGTLYDCRSDTILSGFSLWDEEVLRNIETKRNNEFSEWKVMTGNEEGAKFESLGVSADVKLSVLSGLVKVSGAAEYLNTKNSSTKKSTVTFHFSSIKGFKALSMEQLGNIKYRDFLSTCQATHVVTGIQYGADVFLEFSKSVNETDSKEKVHGNLKFEIEKYLDASGKGSVELDESQTSLKDEIHCSFKGDVSLKTLPTTFLEAVKIYKQIPDMVKQGVVKRIWLHPLVNIDNKASKLVHSISNGVVEKVAKYITVLSNCQVEAKDLMSEVACGKFSRLRSQLATFCEQLEDCDLKFKQEILPILPHIRGGITEERELVEALKKFQRSSFKESLLKKWLDDKQTEITLLNEYCQSLEPIDFAKGRGDIYRIVNNSNHNCVYVLMFTLGDEFDSYLKSQRSFLDSENLDYQQESCYDQWFENDKIKNQIFKWKQYFLHASKRNKDEKIKFIVAEKLQKNDKPEGVVVMVYRHALEERFEVPGRPSKPSSSESTDTTVTLEWEFSSIGKENILGSEVNMLVCHEDRPNWQLAKEIEGNEAKTIISNLAPNGKYKFKITALCRIKPGKESEESEIIETKPQQHRLAITLKQQSQLVKLEGDGKPAQYRLPTEKIMRNYENDITKVFIGPRSRDPCTNQILMVMGATGADMTILLSWFANYYYGVEWKDDFRFIVDTEKEYSQKDLQTRDITAYSFEPMEGAALPFRTIIMDTPCIWDITEMDEDDEAVEKLQQIFSKLSNDRILHLNGVANVVRRPSERFESDHALALFGRDMEKSVFLITTCADGQETPIPEDMNEIGITNKEEYCLSNSALFDKNSLRGENEDMDFKQTSYSIGQATMKNFSDKFKSAPPVSLEVAVEICLLRNHIRMAVVPGGGLSAYPTVEFEDLILKIMDLHKTALTLPGGIDALQIKKSGNSALRPVVFLIQEINKCRERLIDVNRTREMINCFECIDLLIEFERRNLALKMDGKYIIRRLEDTKIIAGHIDMIPP